MTPECPRCRQKLNPDFTPNGYLFPYPEIPGFICDRDLEWLYARACEMESVVEIGTWLGKSTDALVSGCPGDVYTVDHNMGSRDERSGNHVLAVALPGYILHCVLTRFIASENLVVVNMTSEAASKILPDVDMVFIDGDHSKEAVIRDIRAWGPKCRRLLCGHDIHFTSVQEALGELGLRYERETEFIWSVRAEDVRRALEL
jgi:hypothetical protein